MITYTMYPDTLLTLNYGKLNTVKMHPFLQEHDQNKVCEKLTSFINMAK